MPPTEPFILPTKQPSASSAPGQNRNTYKLAAAITIAGFSLAVVFTAFPILADAFWPFITTRAEGDIPSLHDSSMELLDPAINPDPNPSKGTLAIATTEGSALIPSGGPVGALSSLPVGDSSPEADITIYEVREGDSVSEIADMFGVSVATVLSANDIDDPETIQPGDKLRILPVSGIAYTVKRGGTLSDIATLLDADVDELVLYNGFGADEQLAAGTEVIVPGATSATPKKVAAAPSAGVSVVKKQLPVLSGYFGNPVPSAYVSQGVHGKNGIDLAGIPEGTPVYAAAEGTVTKAEFGYNGGYGNYVDVTHNNGTVTRYAHLSSIAVSLGQSVAQGAHLGGVGNTGRSTGYHLHFEVHGAANPFAH